MNYYEIKNRLAQDFFPGGSYYVIRADGTRFKFSSISLEDLQKILEFVWCDDILLFYRKDKLIKTYFKA